MKRSRAHEALLDYRQSDMDGIFVETSRQAIEEVSDEIDELRAQLEAAESDATRYRWLRDEDNFPPDTADDPDPWRVLGECHGLDFDRFIDERMAEQEQPDGR